MPTLTQAEFKALHGIKDTPAASVAPKVQARGHVRPRHVDERMTKVEQQYAEHLDARKLCGELAEWWFESFKIRLASGTWYLADFVLMLPDGLLEIHETKGTKKVKLKSGEIVERAWSEEDANVKLKVSAALYRVFKHYRVFKSKQTGEWILEPKN